MIVGENLAGVALIVVELLLPVLDVILKLLAILLPDRVHQVLQVCEVLPVGLDVKPVVKPAEGFKAVSARNTSDDRERASAANLHEHVEHHLRHNLHFCGELIEDDLPRVILRKL